MPTKNSKGSVISISIQYLTPKMEFKFLVPVNKAMIIREWLKNVGNLDEHCGKQKGYDILSIYLGFWKLKKNNKPMHSKIRIRIYKNFEVNNFYIEEKMKVDKWVYKKRIKVSKMQIIKLLQHTTFTEIENIISSDSSFISKYFFDIGELNLEAITYWREPWVVSTPTGSYRVTFDTNIYTISLDIENEKIHILERSTAPLISDDLVLLEIKGTHMHRELKKILDSFNIYAQKISKYSMAKNSRKAEMLLHNLNDLNGISTT